MAKHLVQITQTNEFEVEIEAKDEQHAIDLVRDFDSDEMAEYLTDARWEYEVI